MYFYRSALLCKYTDKHLMIKKHTSIFQDFQNLEMERYQYGGVNITGFQLVNYSSKFVKTFLTKWNTLDANIWPGARYNSIHVSDRASY